jgi:hypothetical protein
MPWLQRLACVLALGSVLSAQGQTGPFEDNPFPDLFAGLMNLTLSEEVSTATFRVDNGTSMSDDTRFWNLRLPWSHDSQLGSGEDSLRFSATAGVLSAEDHLFIETPSGTATVDEDWLVVGGELGLGWTHPIGRGWAIRPGLALALSYMRNDAEYNDVGRAVLAPLIEEELVNWDAWAATGAVSLTFERPRDPSKLATGWIGRGALARTRVFGATSEVQEGLDSSQFLVLRGEIGGPTAWSRHGKPLTWDVFSGWSGLYGVDEDTLGFDQVFELGAGLKLRVSPRIPPLRLGAAWLTGPDIRGASLGISLD